MARKGCLEVWNVHLDLVHSIVFLVFHWLSWQCYLGLLQFRDVDFKSLLRIFEKDILLEPAHFAPIEWGYWGLLRRLFVYNHVTLNGQAHGAFLLFDLPLE